MALPIPHEIIGVLKRFPGYSICIKGVPGSGKTALSLTILRELSQDRNSLYVSTRVDVKKLYSTFPWAREAVPSSGIIDAAASSDRTGRDLVEHLRFRTMPEFIGALYDKVSDLEDPVVALDSWDAVVERTRSSEDLHNMVLDFACETGARLLLVSETSKDTHLDYLVDGVLDMGFVDTGQEVYRYLQVRKLRGSSHDLRKYVGEINGNGFEVRGLLYR